MPGEEHHEFIVTVPAGTPKTAPVTIATGMPTREVVEIKWTIPPGASGFTGFRITMGGVQVLPANFGGWIVRDGIDGASALARLPNTGAWDVTAYNTGVYPHSIYVTFYVNLIRKATVLPVPFGLDELQFGAGAQLAHRVSLRAP